MPHNNSIFCFLRNRLLALAHHFARDYFPLIFPSALEYPTQYQRIAVLQKRIHILTWVMAIGTPLWSLFDAVVFPDDMWKSILTARLLSGAAFASFLLVGTAVLKAYTRNLWLIYAQLFVTFAMPTLFYALYHQPSEITNPTDPWVAAVVSIYYLLPLIILACIGFFPLTLLESVGFAAPLLVCFYAANHSGEMAASVANLGFIWIMGMMAVIAIVISLSQLRMLIQLVGHASYDAMTTCLGRSVGEAIVKSLWFSAERRNMPFSVALVDLDYFKQINDNFGHQAGDETLAAIAKTIKNSIRKSDFVIRWGGDEFLIAMVDAKLEDSTRILEKIIEKGFGSYSNKEIPTTVSIGVAERVHDGARDSSALILKADERLYKAKTTGRGYVVGLEPAHA